MPSKVSHNLDMLIDRVDERDHSSGTIVRSKVFDEKANFRVAHILIFSTSGNLLVQRLAPSRDRNPLKWGSSVASYVPAGESYEGAAQERLRDELGIEHLALSRLGKTVMNDQGCQKFITVFTATYDGPIAADQTHIAKVEYVSLRTVLDMVKDLTPTFRHIIDAILTQNLK
jgi:isopentenyldiphosphate isomerase